MKLVVLAVGRLKERAWTERADEYMKRAGRFAPCEMKEVKAGAGGDGTAVLAEAERLLAAVEERDTVVVCEEGGRQLSTAELADWIGGRFAAGGAGRLVFVVGGADGISPAVIRRADLRLGLSRLTLPHELARVVLLEQLYRVLTLNAGHPYHRE